MEKPIVFGEAENLFGIVNLPDGNHAPTAVIMLTAGMLHHVGSFRFHVLLARELEKAGILSLRFDLSGIGESLATGMAGDSLARAARETGYAIDWLSAEHDIDNVILFGLCSGADDAWHVARQDERVKGLAMIDGLGYSTKLHQKLVWMDKARKFSSPSYWNAKIRRKHGELHIVASGLPEGNDIREFPNRDTAADDLKGFITRGIHILACYTSGAKDYYNYPEQFAEMFHDVSLPATVKHCFYKHMDHVALLKEDRRELLDRFSSWIKETVAALPFENDRFASVAVPE